MFLLVYNEVGLSFTCNNLVVSGGLILIHSLKLPNNIQYQEGDRLLPIFYFRSSYKKARTAMHAQ
jgi:hypothetical protein